MSPSNPRKSLRFLAQLSLALVPITLISCRPATEPPADTTVELRDGWRIVAAAESGSSGDAISSPEFDDAQWISASVPTTVLAALFAGGAVPDPYFGRNLEQIPAEPFAGPWWYRTEFTLHEPLPAAARLIFEGINYSAEAWLNGQRIAGRQELAGAFRMFEIDVTDRLVAGANALAVAVHPPQPGDFTIGFVDWNPTPPDRNMGLWRPVKLRLTGEVALDEIFVESDLDLESYSTASLTVSAKVTNFADRAITAKVAAAIDEEIEIEQTVELGPGEERRLVFLPSEFPSLVVDRPRLWWPNNLGDPNLYGLEMTATLDGRFSDRQEVSFGIREIDDYLNDEGHRGYRINGKRLLIRGGGWVDDMLLADDDQRLEDQIRYVRHMNLNTIRMEGFWGSSQKIFDLADRYGILVMVGWSCQWEWEAYLGGPVDEYGGIDTPAETELITRSLRDQVIWLRNHPSVFLWVLASDMLPRPEVEQSYRRQLAEIDTTRPLLAACAAGASQVSGPSGVKMNGPYDWVPPVYWYVDRERGGAYGFNTETGPGPQPPPVESIRRMLPEDNWWPIDEMWEYHCGRNEFNTLERYNEALIARYGEVSGLEEFARQAQVANYEGMRAMFESFSIRRPSTTGIIQWMLNSAWPEMYWQLYDHYLVPNGAFYGARHANRPLNIAYDYADGGIVVVNDTAAPLSGVTAAVRILDPQSRVLFEDSRTVDLPAEARERLFSLPPVAAEDKTYFVDARLLGSDGDLLASSLYWLSTQKDELDWEASLWFVTPTAQFADLTALRRLPPVELEVEHSFQPADDGQAVEVTLSNPSDHLAFFVELAVVGAESGRLAAPVFWSDNYVSLLPGERRTVHGTVPAHALPGEAPVLRYRGINVAGE